MIKSVGKKFPWPDFLYYNEGDTVDYMKESFILRIKEVCPWHTLMCTFQVGIMEKEEMHLFLIF